MFGTAVLYASGVALTSLVGAVFFGSHQRLIGLERFVVPVAVGVFLSLALYGMIPHVLEDSPEWGGVVVMLGFVGFYVLAQFLHQHFHAQGTENCDRRSAAILVLIGDAIHNFADGVVLATAFMVDPALAGVAALALVAHEIPQEIVEFGVLIRGGFSRFEAIKWNLISASSIVVGVAVTFWLAEALEESVWMLTAVAAGTLLFLAASDLLPRIHGNLSHYGSVWYAAASILFGFAVMTAVIMWSHPYMQLEHDDEHEIGVLEEVVATNLRVL